MLIIKSKINFMKKYLFVSLFLFLPFFAKADTQVFGFMNGNFYNVNGDLKYACLGDGNCYDYLTQQMTTLGKILGLSTTEPQTITVVSGKPTLQTQPQVIYVPVPIPVPTPVSSPVLAPQINPVTTATTISILPTEINPTFSYINIPISSIASTIGGVGIRIFGIRNMSPFNGSQLTWTEIQYTITSNDFPLSDISLVCGLSDIKMSLNDNCNYPYIFFYLNNFHPGTLSINITGAKAKSWTDGTIYDLPGFPINSGIITLY